MPGIFMEPPMAPNCMGAEYYPTTLAQQDSTVYYHQNGMIDNSSPSFTNDNMVMTAELFRGMRLSSNNVECSRASSPDYAALNEPDAYELMRMAAASGFAPNGLHRKSQNTTECVPVPSSEHVAEIVGRQGCKIKALRAKTNTYIKTPVRGEDSVFVVTGRKEDVDAAKHEIVSAAEHFTQIRASRRHSQGGIPAPGHITAYVRVPYKFVGLVVGPKGATIKRIQQQTHTYIITPSREKEPIFEVTGLADNVEAARREIEAHIGSRTGQALPPSFADGSAAGSDYDSISINDALSFDVHSRSASVLLSEFRSNGTETPCIDLRPMIVPHVVGGAKMTTLPASGESSLVSSLGALSSSSSMMMSLAVNGGGPVGSVICKPQSNISNGFMANYTEIAHNTTNFQPRPIHNNVVGSFGEQTQVQFGYHDNAWFNTSTNHNMNFVKNDVTLSSAGFRTTALQPFNVVGGVASAKVFRSLHGAHSSGGTSSDQDEGVWSSNGGESPSSLLSGLDFNVGSFDSHPCSLLPSLLGSIWSDIDEPNDLAPKRSASSEAVNGNENIIPANKPFW